MSPHSLAHGGWFNNSFADRPRRKGTVTDNQYPTWSAGDMSKAVLEQFFYETCVHGRAPVAARLCTKRFQPDGLIGFYAERLQTVLGHQPVEKFHLAEETYLGYIAIEHNKSGTDFSDMCVGLKFLQLIVLLATCFATKCICFVAFRPISASRIPWRSGSIGRP
jgi:hypothetical protein